MMNPELSVAAIPFAIGLTILLCCWLVANENDVFWIVINKSIKLVLFPIALLAILLSVIPHGGYLITNVILEEMVKLNCAMRIRNSICRFVVIASFAGWELITVKVASAWHIEDEVLRIISNSPATFATVLMAPAVMHITTALLYGFYSGGSVLKVFLISVVFHGVFNILSPVYLAPALSTGSDFGGASLIFLFLLFFVACTTWLLRPVEVSSDPHVNPNVLTNPRLVTGNADTARL